MAKKNLVELQKKFSNKVSQHKASRGHKGHHGTIDPATLKVALLDLLENVKTASEAPTPEGVKAAFDEIEAHLDDIIATITD